MTTVAGPAADTAGTGPLARASAGAAVAGRRAVRWGLQHGMARRVIGKAAKEGDLQARLIIDPSVRADPFPLQDRIREQGPVFRGRLTYVTATHEVVR